MQFCAPSEVRMFVSLNSEINSNTGVRTSVALNQSPLGYYLVSEMAKSIQVRYIFVEI